MVTTFRLNDVKILVQLMCIKQTVVILVIVRTRHYDGCAVMHLAIHIHILTISKQSLTAGTLIYVQ